MTPPLARAAIVAEARAWLGTPYRHQASAKGAGCDCLGLARGLWRALLGAEPEAATPYDAAWALSTARETLAEAARRHLVEIAPVAARPGDILLFRWRARLPASHVAVLATPTTLIHAHDGAMVAEVAFTPWWRRHLAYAFAFPGVTD